MRRSLVIAAVLVAIAFVLVGGPAMLTSTSTTDVGTERESDPKIVTPEGSESGFWPYLSAREAHERRSPINLIVRGDADEIVRLLSEEADGDWNETEDDHFEIDDLRELNGTDVERNGSNATRQQLASEIPWAETAGATRYAYLDPGPDESAYWTDETVQVDDGDYYGQRYHIRLYESPNADDRWVVMQAHTEHFDWFTLRHRVDGAEAAQSKVESDLLSIPGIDPYDGEDVRRINLGNGGSSEANGWATEVDLTAATAILPLFVGLAARNGLGRRAWGRVDRHLTDGDRRRLEAVAERVEPRHFVLAGTIVALFLGVRYAGIALERHAEFLTMHGIAALLYPVIAIGIPAATYLLASGLERRIDAATVAAAALAAAIWIDYGLVGIDRLALDVVFQRILVVVALGLIAGGAARRATRESRWNDMLVGGVVLWSLVLVGTLVGYL